MASRKKIAGHRHRANHLVFGQVGRVTYIPSEEDHDDDVEVEEGPGELYANRAVGDLPEFRQLISFEEWFAGTASPEPPLPPADHRGQRSQQRWLFRSCPEALMGNIDLKEDLKRESKAAGNGKQTRRDPGAKLISIGDITDASTPSRTTACQAVAFASGDSGDVLRVVKLAEDRRQPPEPSADEGWAHGRSPWAMHLTAPDARYQGFWSEKGVAITHVRFASGDRRKNRWLVVQTALSTMIFEPRVLHVPVWTDLSHTARGSFNGASYVSVHPIVTVKASQTGGPPHSDVSLNMGSGGDPHQLAIIDVLGNWTIWDITGHTDSYRKTLEPMLRLSGRVDDSLGADAGITFPSSAPESCQVAWVMPAVKNVSGRRGLDDLGGRSGFSPFVAGRSPGAADPGRGKSLVVCSGKVFRLINLKDPANLTTFELVNPRKLDKILDIAVCPTDPSRVFVLTSMSVFWLELASSVEPEHSSVAILLSSSHLRSAQDDSLRLNVALVGTENSHSLRTWLVCVNSTVNSRLILFWFTSPDSSSPTQRQASFHHRTMCLVPGGEQDASQHRSLLLMPQALSDEQASAGLYSRSRPHSESFEVAQVLVLDHSLGLSSAAFSIGRNYKDLSTVIANDAVLGTKHAETNKRWLFQFFRDGFVIQDDLAKLLEGTKGARRQKQAAPIASSAGRGERQCLNFSTFVRLITDRVRASVVAALAPPLDSEPWSLEPIQKFVQERPGDQQLPLTTLMEIASQSGAHLAVGVHGTGWTAEMDRLQQWATAEGLRLVNLDSSINVSDAMDFRERLLYLWPSHWKGDTPGQEALQARAMLIEHIAAEVLLSRIGLSIPSSGPAHIDKARGLEEHPAPLDVSAVEALSAPQPSARASSAPLPDSAHRPEGKDKVGEAQEDAAVSRLRQYAVSIGAVPPRKEQSLLLSHWPEETGSDPHGYEWEWEPDGLSQRIEAAVKKREARHKRRLDKRVDLGLAVESEALMGAGATAVSSTQPVPPVSHHSQIIHPSSRLTVGAAGPYQILSSQAPGISSFSQPVEGKHGGRLHPAGKKKGQSSQGLSKSRGFR